VVVNDVVGGQPLAVFWQPGVASAKPETRVYVAEGPAPDVGERAPESEPASNATPPPIPVDALTHDFEVTVYAGADVLGGERVMFSEVLGQGRPVVLEFFAGLCPTCRRALPETQEAHVRYRDDVLFLGLDIGPFTGLGNEEDARALYADLSLSFPAGSISDVEVLRAYRVTGMPTTLYFKPNGELFERGGGINGIDALSEKLDALIAASGF
jgi:thiol-disulfide isomerase/thioredoxin